MVDYSTDENRSAPTEPRRLPTDAVDDDTTVPPPGLLTRLFHRHVRDERGRYQSRLFARGEFQVLSRRTSKRLRLPPYILLYDVRFFRMQKGYLWQSSLAVFAILAVLLLVDSVADAALAAGLGSSTVIVFLHPTSRSAGLRNLVGGHILGSLVGAAASLLLFQTGWFPANAELSHWFADGVAAGVLGLVILLMAATDTEHPPAAATALGFALQSLEWPIIFLFGGAVMVLAVVKVVLRNRLQDLID